MRKEATILIDHGIFMDEAGNLNYTRLKDSICVAVTLARVEKMERIARQG